MTRDNRVLGRKGARELTIHETEHVTGAIRTEAPCSVKPNGQLDGVPADC